MVISESSPNTECNEVRKIEIDLKQYYKTNGHFYCTGIAAMYRVLLHHKDDAWKQVVDTIRGLAQ